MKFMQCIVLAAALTSLPFAASAQGKPAPKDALLYFVWPQNGTVIKGGFWCRFGLRNMGVTHAGDNYPNSGHHHLLVDVKEPLNPNEPIPQDKSHLHFGAGQTEAAPEPSFDGGAVLRPHEIKQRILRRGLSLGGRGEWQASERCCENDASHEFHDCLFNAP